MTIGDIFAVVAVILITAGAWMATILLAGLFFSERAHQAAQQIATAPVFCALRGVGMLLLLGIPSFILLTQAGPMRLVSLLFGGVLALCAAVGSAGAVQMLSRRVLESGTTLSPFAAITRSAFLYVTSGLTPIIGWFVVTPLALLVSLGAAACPKSRAKPTGQNSDPDARRTPTLQWEPRL